MRSLDSNRLRTVDVARHTGYSVQQVRNLEKDGVLPTASRTASGYRTYTEIHVRSAQAYRALAAGVGPVDAKQIVRAAHRQPADVLALLDAAHAQLHAERTDLALAQAAAEVIATEPIVDIRPADSMSIAELAAALGIRASTLRHWEADGLVVAQRVSGARRYAPEQVRDVRIVHQLRTAGYRIATLHAVLPQLRRSEGIHLALAARDKTIALRSAALLEGGAALHTLLALVQSCGPPPTAESSCG